MPSTQPNLTIREHRLLQIITIGPALILLLALIGLAIGFFIFSKEEKILHQDVKLELQTQELHLSFKQQMNDWHQVMLSRNPEQLEERWHTFEKQLFATEEHSKTLLAMSDGDFKINIETFIYSLEVLNSAYTEAKQTLKHSEFNTDAAIEITEYLDKTPSAVLEVLSNNIRERTLKKSTSNRALSLRLMVLGLLVMSGAGVTIISMGYVQAYRTIKKQHRASDRVQWLSLHDSATGLPNRSQLDDTLSTHIKNRKTRFQPFYLLHISITNFKSTSNSHGYDLSNKLITEVSSKLQELILPNSFLSRVRDDEFIIILYGLSNDCNLDSYCDRIIRVLTKPIVIDDYTHILKVNIGISEYPKDGNKPVNLLKGADIALHFAIKTTSNCHQVYSEGVECHLRRQESLIHEMRQALNSQQFYLLYQPQIDIEKKKIIGVEALLRWRAPSGSMIPPAEFIPLAEETGLIVPLGKWVVHEACLQLKRWKDRDIDLSMAINLSPKQFHDESTMQLVKDNIREMQLNPGSLELEITESLFADNIENHLQRLRAQNIKVSLDDFGTGYSNLGYLPKLSLDKLKIDRSFIIDIHKEPGKQSIVSAILELGKKFEMAVLAEGVETLEELDCMKEMGCQQIQGFIFSKPITAEDVEQLLTRPLLPSPAD